MMDTPVDFLFIISFIPIWSVVLIVCMCVCVQMPWGRSNLELKHILDTCHSRSPPLSQSFSVRCVWGLTVVSDLCREIFF